MFIATSIKESIDRQKQFFLTGETKEIDFRIEKLKKLRHVIANSKKVIADALKADLNKPEFESYLIEISVIREIDYAIERVRSWAKPKRIKVPLDPFFFPSSAFVCPEPLGVVLIISPWNYPFSLAISPLIGAIAAGNCAVIKPSEISSNTSRILAEIISKAFDPEQVMVVEGGVETTQELLAEKFDKIFFTGSTRVGKIVMAAAAKHLTPVTLELGGKSPCIVDTDVDILETAKRIAWGKFINAGQTCIAPDYLLVDRSVKADLLAAIEKSVRDFYGDDPSTSQDLARIINEYHFDRLMGFLSCGEIVFGAQSDRATRYLAPTVIQNVPLDAPIMQEEIFGPILPVIEYKNLEEAIAIINNFSKPLALYLFSRDKSKQERVLAATSSGGVCINDTIVQVGVPELPFGGVGESGMGSYHGKASFDAFSHQKSVLKKSFLFKLNVRYAPYLQKLERLRTFLK